MISSIQKSTLKQYEKPLRLWWNFCENTKTSIHEITSTKVTQFLTQSDLQKASYSTLNIYRSALSLLNLNDLGKDPGLARFFKGLSVIKPQKPKYDSIWDPEPVINYLEKLQPNEEISLENLTKKSVTLLALSTAQRLQTLAIISIDNISISEEKLQIEVPDRTKTSGRNRTQPFLNIPKFENRPNLCVVAVIQAYLRRTKAFGEKTKSCLLLLKSRIVKQVLRLLAGG